MTQPGGIGGSRLGRWRDRLGRRGGPRGIPIVVPGAELRTFFLVGAPKSGTSWLMNLLNTHPEILCRGEGRFFGTHHKLGDARAASFEHALMRSAEIRDWTKRSAWTRQGEHEPLARALTAVAARAIMAGALAESGKSVVGDKTPLNGDGVVASIGEAIPEARVIHIIRDGRDVAVSWAHHRWNDLGTRPDASPERYPALAVRDRYRADPARFVAEGRSLFEPERLSAIAESWALRTEAAIAEGNALGPHRYTEIRYETLLGDGVGELVRLFRFLGTDGSPEIARRCLRSQDFERLTGGRAPGSEDSTAFLRSGIAGNWREVFTDADHETFDRVAGGTLATLGYSRHRG